MVKTIQYLFSKTIPWQLKKNIVIPGISREIFERVKNEANKFYAICPGYLLESIIAVSANDIFIRSGIEIEKWIMPKCYSKVLKYYNLNYKGSNGDMFLEYKRLIKAVKAYPVPIFMDKDNNVYFNLLFNYGARVNCKNIKVSNNVVPFWKQLLNNTCLMENYEQRNFNIEFEDKINKFLAKDSIDPYKNFVLIDNSNLFGTTANGLKIKNNFMFLEQVRDIAECLYKKNIQCVIMTNNKKEYFGRNVFTINSWNKINFVILLSLLQKAYTVVSSDPNIYLTAAIVGCERIITNDACPGWTFDDLNGFCGVSENWINKEGLTTQDIIKILQETF